jgi:tRNA (guanine-N7-)-methyltransferase
VRRTGRLPLEELQPYLLDLPRSGFRGQAAAPAPAEPLAWTAVFGNDSPVEIEVGFGKGMFLVSAAEAHPDINYFGLEIERKYQLHAANRLAKRRLSNVRLACADARTFLCERVRDSSVQAVHVYFPDPWWKTRHRKRRLFTEEFTIQCTRVLKPGGHLHVATDVADYFAEIVPLLQQQPRLRQLPAPAPHEPQHDLDYLTNFERKYRKESRPIWRAVFQASG